ncbi:MAG: hypothetical protein DMF35_08500 [Verrucomicrobia bacterium]|nr:MAG: hypothetical protein DMF35_08500 [Verrucomicrobiota bacterium]
MIRLRPEIRSPAARAAINFSEEIVNSLSMGKPKIDDKLTLLSDFGEMEAICVEVRDDPATSGGTLLKVMARGPFTEGEQVWIVDRDGSKIGATVENVFKQTIDSEVTFSTVLPA